MGGNKHAFDQYTADSRGDSLLFHTSVASTNVTLKPYETTVVIVDSSAGAITMYLPSPERCAGKIFSIHKIDTDTTAITLSDNNKSVDWDGDYTIDAQNDGIVLYCDGRRWWALLNVIA